jgi:hypothetical protein
MERPAEVGDFASRFVATKSHVSGGRFRSRTARSDLFFFAFRHFCEMEVATLRLVSRVLTPVAILAHPGEARARHGRSDTDGPLEDEQKQQQRRRWGFGSGN